jgi:hypothetical protein
VTAPVTMQSAALRRSGAKPQPVTMRAIDRGDPPACGGVEPPPAALGAPPSRERRGGRRGGEWRL